MAARFSANGKRIGRPPKAQTPEPSAADAMLGQAFQKFVARYDAAGNARRMAAWKAPSTGPNVAINGSLQTLRNRSADAVRNDWSAGSIVTRWSTALVGIAITPRFRRIKDKARRQQIMDLHADFMRQIDADGVLDGYGMQTLAVRSWMERGEMFARRRYRTLADGLAVPLQVQLLEADMVPVFDADAWEGMRPGNYIRSGIEFDRRGQRRAYWVYKQHPGDGTTGSPFAPSASMLVRVPAEDMLHMYEPGRIGERRGVPELSNVLARQRNIVDYEDVVLERQKIANLFVAFVSRSLPQIDVTDPDQVAGMLSGLQETLDDAGSPLLPMRPGLLQELEDGQTVNFANPPDPATNYSEYLRTSHLGTSAGVGLPYELMSGDIQNVSDRTLRVIINEFRRYASQRQWQIVIPMFCQKIIDWFVDAAVLSGQISLAEANDVRRVEHAPHGWEYIHPVQDVQGKALEVTNGFRSRSSVIAEKGEDPDLVDQERANDREREELLGLPTTGGAPSGGTNDPADDKGEGEIDSDEIDNDEYSSPPNPAGNGVRAKFTEAQRLASLEASIQQLLGEKPPQ